MARKVINKKEFLIIVMTPEEAINKCQFGFYDRRSNATILIDDDTNELLNLEDYVYYVAVLNRLFKKSTIRHWLNSKTTKRYEEDIPFEERHFNYIANLLKL